jgi:hypothetical protein
MALSNFKIGHFPLASRYSPEWLTFLALVPIWYVAWRKMKKDKTALCA